MTFGELITKLASDPSFYAIYLLLLLSFANFAIGTAKAGFGRFFEGEVWYAWVSKDSRAIIPIIFGLLFAKALGNVTVLNVGDMQLSAGSFFGGYALVQALTTIVSLSDSIKEKLAPNPALKVLKSIRAADAQENIPHD
jgi:hypothetical protein